MKTGDFFGSEKSITVSKEKSVSIIFEDKNGGQKVLKSEFPILKDEIIDCAVMNIEELEKFFENVIQESKEEDILFHCIWRQRWWRFLIYNFCKCIEDFYAEIFKSFKELDSVGINPNNGSADLFSKLHLLDKPTEDKINSLINEIHRNNPSLAMVDSDKGISNLHVPSDVIIDASMPAMIRNSVNVE